MERITSSKNPFIKELKKIKNSGSGVDGIFLAEGENMINGILDSGVVPVAVIYDGGKEGLDRVIHRLKLSGCRMICSNDQVVSSISLTKSPQGIVCAVQKSDAVVNLNSIGHDISSVVILENVSDPGNVGTIIRTAEAMGIDLVVSIGGAGVFGDKVMRSTAGAFFNQKISVCSEVTETINKLKDMGFMVYGSSLRPDSVDIRAGEMSGKVAVVIGNESSGISEDCYKACNGTVKIPMYGKVQSLNAAVAASIFMWEMTKNRR